MNFHKVNTEEEFKNKLFPKYLNIIGLSKTKPNRYFLNSINNNLRISFYYDKKNKVFFKKNIIYNIPNSYYNIPFKINKHTIQIKSIYVNLNGYELLDYHDNS